MNESENAILTPASGAAKLTDMMFADYPDVVDIRDLMRMLDIGRNTALELVRTHTIKGLIVGNRYRIPKINVIRYLLGDAEAS